MRRLALSLVLVIMSAAVCVASADALELVGNITSPHWKYVVMAHTYPALDANVVVVTSRESGLSVWNSSDPLRPVLLAAWNESSMVEGQAWDVETETLMVVDIGKSAVWTFRLWIDKDGQLSLVQRGFLRVSSKGALHGRMYRPGNGKLYGVVSNGFTVDLSSLVLIDLSDPAFPRLATTFATPDVVDMEGVFVHDGYAMIGGFGGHTFQVVDIRDPTHPSVVRSLAQPYYLQMVSSAEGAPYSGLSPAVLYTALWGDNGGIATFDMTDPAALREMDHLVGPQMGKANRVRLDLKRGVAYLPLEGHAPGTRGLNGGIAVVDVSNPASLSQVGATIRLPEPTLCYDLALPGGGDGAYVWAFGADTSRVYVYRSSVSQSTTVYHGLSRDE